MTAPESIPEDRESSYPCPCGGSITLIDKSWCCDSCDFERLDARCNTKQEKK